MDHYHSDCLAEQSGVVVGEFLGSVVGLAFGAARQGAFVARSVVEDLAWGVPAGVGVHRSSCGCCEIHHHYRYHCVPGCHCGSCG